LLPADDRFRAEVARDTVAVLQRAAPWSVLRDRLQRRPAILASRMDEPTRRVLVAHVAAVLGTSLVLMTGSTDERIGAALGLGMMVAIGALRTANVRRSLATSTLALDAVGTAVFLAGTGAPSSAFFFLALAGAWWAAHVPRRHSGTMWAAAFTVVYLILVVPAAIMSGLLVHALGDASVVVIIGVLSDGFVRVDARALALSEALAKAPAGAEKLAIREGLTRAYGPMEISLGVLLAASREGLTVIQAELLAYLTLGLTNQEIADATKVSVPTVRYRLTRLYRAIGVQGRKEAAGRARQIGLTGAADIP
jgi:DNA-binding CsgD family transcriptional regulator